MLTKNQQLEKNNLEWFSPNLFKQFPPEEGEFENYLAHSERGGELKGRQREWNNFNVYSEAKRLRGITIHELWESSFYAMDGSWVGFYNLLKEEDGQPIPEHIAKYISSEIFRGQDREKILSCYSEITSEI